MRILVRPLLNSRLKIANSRKEVSYRRLTNWLRQFYAFDYLSVHMFTPNFVICQLFGFGNLKLVRLTYLQSDFYDLAFLNVFGEFIANVTH